MTRPRNSTPDDLARLSMAPDRWTQDLLSRAPADMKSEVPKRTFLLVVGCLRRYRAAVFLLTGSFTEDAVIIGRPLQEDAARLRVLAEASEEKRAAYLWGYWSDDLANRRKMIEAMARSKHAEPLEPIIDRRRSEQTKEDQALSRLQQEVGGRKVSLPKDGDLVERLGGVRERVAWASASISAHSSWSTHQPRYLERDGSGEVKVWITGREESRTLGLYVHSFGRWLFAAAEAFETIHRIEPQGATSDEFETWHADVHRTLGVRDIDAILSES